MEYFFYCCRSYLSALSVGIFSREMLLRLVVSSSIVDTSLGNHPVTKIKGSDQGEELSLVQLMCYKLTLLLSNVYKSTRAYPRARCGQPLNFVQVSSCDMTGVGLNYSRNQLTEMAALYPEVMESEMSDYSPTAPRKSQHTPLVSSRSGSPPRYDAVLAQDPQARETAAQVRRGGGRGFTESMARAGESKLDGA